MIDTLRLTGSGKHYRFKPSYSKYTVFKRDGKPEYIQGIQLEQTGNYRCFYSPSHDNATVEFNASKIIFRDNWTNYANNSIAIDTIIRVFSEYFFFRRTCYIARIDLGFVQDFMTEERANEVLEMFRGARFPGARKAKFLNQAYDGSVFYSTRNWAVKIYNKGREQKMPQGHPLRSVLRYEKTYRFNELKRIGMPVTPTKGVLVRDFDSTAILTEFWQLWTGWDLQAKPYQVSGLKGSAALLQVIEQSGLLGVLETQNSVSRSTIWRYKKKRKSQKQIEPPTITYTQTNDPKKNVRYAHFLLNPAPYICSS